MIYDRRFGMILAASRLSDMGSPERERELSKKRSGSSGPGDPPPRHPDCTCGPWKLVNGHWTFVIEPGCPVHTDG